MADIGQDEDFEKAKQKAKTIGAKDVSDVHFKATTLLSSTHYDTITKMIKSFCRYTLLLFK